MSLRYCGSLTINIHLLADSTHYNGSISRNGSVICKLTHLRLSEEEQRNIAADSHAAWDAIAHSAMSFGSFEHGDDVGSFGELSEFDDSWVIRRHK
jgi:hypothetical protein